MTGVQTCALPIFILPDLPMDLFVSEYKAIFDEYAILNIFLITPQTTDDRIRLIDDVSDGFIYMVSSASITGSVSGISDGMRAYFERIAAMNLRNPRLVGFGINNQESFDAASEFANGAIVGSAFVRHLHENGPDATGIQAFVETVRG